MLINLHVKNLALIKEIDVDFSNGLIVLTGETGAGKSLLLGSVNIALGNKVSRDMIRTGAEFALVEMTFLADSDCISRLREMDIFVDDDKQVTVTRKISEGRSISKINGETVNINILKKVMGMLVDIHGQHEHQSLLYSANHLMILDKFAKGEMNDLPAQLKQEYRHFLDLKSKLAEYDMDESQRAREMEFALYEVNEIDSANLKSGEDVLLEEQFHKLSNSENIVNALSGIYNFLCYDNSGSAGDLITRAVQEINNINDFDERIHQFRDTLYDIDTMCRELTSEIYDYNSELEYHPESIKEVEERLDIINHLKLKYGKSIEEILSYRDKKQEYIDSLNHYGQEIEKINAEISDCEIKINNLCEKISKKRAAASGILEKKVREALTELNFLSVNFKIDITKKDKITENGFDNVEFMISTNPGEPLKPLVKVASGGELSRIMLAIKSILATEDEIDTLIFDEIDTGISGKTAQMVAEKLAKISKNHQVICISHLSQIAAMADNHYLIKKDMENNSTSTTILKLDRDQSIQEIVRINGGGTMTDAAFAHAVEMKDMADRTKSDLV